MKIQILFKVALTKKKKRKLDTFIFIATPSNPILEQTLPHKISAKKSVKLKV